VQVALSEADLPACIAAAATARGQRLATLADPVFIARLRRFIAQS
jgi:hypothetical protein